MDSEGGDVRTHRIADPANLEALYAINKHAKQYAEQASENYRQKKGATAKYNSVRKDALYAVKTLTLKALLDKGTVERIERHLIDGDEFYCFYFGGWSFHQPADAWRWSPPSETANAEPQPIDEYVSDSEKHATDMSLKASLIRLHDEYGINANDHLPQERVSYGMESYFAGWSYL